LLDPASGVKKLGKHMTAKKKFRLRMLILAMLLVSIAFVPAASAKADKVNTNNSSDSEVETYGIEGLTPEKVKEIEARANYLENLPDSVHNAPYWAMVAADKDTKKAVLQYIDKLSVSNFEKEEMKKSMNDIWNRVPDKITEKDYPVIQKVGDAVTKYIEETYWADKQSVQWTNAGGHYAFSYYGTYLIFNNNNWAVLAGSYGGTPDWWDTGVDRYYKHYYNPDLGYGGAPGACSDYATLAKSQYATGDRTQCFINNGLASHYLSDVGNPMHTGGEISQGLDYLLGNSHHIAYEQYVEGNWSSNYKYLDLVTSNTVVTSVTDPNQAVRDLAAVSHPYFGTLWEKVTQDPSNFGSNIDVRYITTKCVRETARYNAGLAQHLKN
jgi:hypothetical protein